MKCTFGTSNFLEEISSLMDRGSRHCTGGRDQDHPQEKEMQKELSEEALQIAEKRKAKGKRSKEKIYSCECRVPKNSKER